MTVANPYRIVQTVSGKPVKLLDAVYPLRRDAEAWVHNNRSDWGPKYRVIQQAQVEETLLDIRANVLKTALNRYSFLIATDYDDARDRLLKIADKIDASLASGDRPPRGWLKTEVGLHGLYDCLFYAAERRRVGSGAYTPDERAMLGGRSSNWGRSTTNVVLIEAEAEYDHQLKNLASASLRATS